MRGSLCKGLLLVILLNLMIGKISASQKETHMKLSSTVFGHEGPIPKLYTCEGRDISPPIAWEGAPESAKSLVLIVEDPDAPDPKAPKMVWDHWLLFNIDPKSKGFKEAISANEMPNGTKDGLNSWGKTGYGGPCPPIGVHRYYFRLYALDTLLDLKPNPIKTDIAKAMQKHIIAETVLMGTYIKSR